MSISENLEGSYLDALAGQRSVEHRKILWRMKICDYPAGNVLEPLVEDSTLFMLSCTPPGGAAGGTEDNRKQYTVSII